MGTSDFDRDAVLAQLSGVANGLNRDQQLAFALALVVALCERVQDGQLVSEAIADARRALGSDG
ncbi:MAG: hypothetical protein J4F49_09740 [Rhodobacteraceae bacterium]|nr:hypothetical protein [Paracoccaceae bacterium]